MNQNRRHGGAEAIRVTTSVKGEEELNCYYHSDREAIGTCVGCGKPICPECKVTLEDRFYCNPCADAAYSKSVATPAIRRSENWFARHLNWTAVFSWIAIYPIVFVGAMVVGIFMYSSDSYIAESEVKSMSFLIALVLSSAWLLPTNGWVLKKKGQSLWHLLWLYVPFGFFVILGLQNKNEPTTYEYTGTMSL